VADARDRLRDALGALRALYVGTLDARSRAALEVAGKAVAAAHEATADELPDRLDVAIRELDGAVRAVPWAAQVLLGALQRLRGLRPAPGPANDTREPFPHLFEEK
jgi:hypothetical protein